MFSAAMKGRNGRGQRTWNKKSSGRGSRINIWFSYYVYSLVSLPFACQQECQGECFSCIMSLPWCHIVLCFKIEAAIANPDFLKENILSSGQNRARVH